jgi:hypothetical protein
MIETPTPSRSVPIPVSKNNSSSNLNNYKETKCSCNTFDPSSSPPKDDFMEKLIKRIGSFDNFTNKNYEDESSFSINSINLLNK